MKEENLANIQRDKKKEKKNKKKVIRFFIKLGIVVGALWATFTFVFGIFQVKGEAMYPRLRDGDLTLCYRLDSNYDIGDVVAFKISDNRRFARVVARAGDIIDISDSGQLIVNGNVQTEEVHYPTQKLAGGISYPYTVPDSSYFLLCDFRSQSSDSRMYGAVNKSDIDGKIMTILRHRGI